MQYLNRLLDSSRNLVRRLMTSVAKALNHLSGGRLNPNFITVTSLLMHLPIAWLIADGRFVFAAVLLVVFGLFDSLDGALARLQNKASSKGMLLDATTDRMKEVLLYIGIAFALVDSGQPYQSVWAIAALGGSLIVSYVKAKGETAVAGGSLSANEINRLFQDGLLRFEVRMFLLVAGLLLDQLYAILIVIAVLSWVTAFERLIKISKKL